MGKYVDFVKAIVPIILRSNNNDIYKKIFSQEENISALFEGLEIGEANKIQCIQKINALRNDLGRHKQYLDELYLYTNDTIWLNEYIIHGMLLSLQEITLKMREDLSDDLSWKDIIPLEKQPNFLINLVTAYTAKVLTYWVQQHINDHAMGQEIYIYDWFMQMVNLHSVGIGKKNNLVLKHDPAPVLQTMWKEAKEKKGPDLKYLFILSSKELLRITKRLFWVKQQLENLKEKNNLNESVYLSIVEKITNYENKIDEIVDGTLVKDLASLDELIPVMSDMVIQEGESILREIYSALVEEQNRLDNTFLINIAQELQRYIKTLDKQKKLIENKNKELNTFVQKHRTIVIETKNKYAELMGLCAKLIVGTQYQSARSRLFFKAAVADVFTTNKVDVSTQENFFDKLDSIINEDITTYVAAFKSAIFNEEITGFIHINKDIIRKITDLFKVFTKNFFDEIKQDDSWRQSIPERERGGFVKDIAQAFLLKIVTEWRNIVSLNHEKTEEATYLAWFFQEIVIHCLDRDKCGGFLLTPPFFPSESIFVAISKNLNLDRESDLNFVTKSRNTYLLSSLELWQMFTYLLRNKLQLDLIKEGCPSESEYKYAQSLLIDIISFQGNFNKKFDRISVVLKEIRDFNCHNQHHKILNTRPLTIFSRLKKSPQEQLDEITKTITNEVCELIDKQRQFLGQEHIARHIKEQRVCLVMAEIEKKEKNADSIVKLTRSMPQNNHPVARTKLPYQSESNLVQEIKAAQVRRSLSAGQFTNTMPHTMYSKYPKPQPALPEHNDGQKPGKSVKIDPNLAIKKYKR